MTNENVLKFWQEFCQSAAIPIETHYDLWYFGDNPQLADELLALVFSGKKTATAALVWEYEDNPQAAAKLNGYSVVTDFHGQPKCVLQTTEVRILPFNQVDAQFAADEGEGDLTLEFWRNAHWRYFSRKCQELHKTVSEDMPVICERFVKLYPA